MFGLFRKRKAPNQSRNDALRAELAARGDDGTGVRRVVHRATPSPAGDINATVVQDFLAIKGFQLTEAEGGGFAFAEHRAVAGVDFDAHTDELDKALAGWRWRYGGWSCPGA
jgi:carbamate kinase